MFRPLHWAISNCASEETIQWSIRNEISLRILHCIVSSEAQFETWWWPSARAETCSLSNKHYTTLLDVFRLYYPVPSYCLSAFIIVSRISWYERKNITPANEIKVVNNPVSPTETSQDRFHPLCRGRQVLRAV